MIANLFCLKNINTETNTDNANGNAKLPSILAIIYISKINEIIK